MCHYVLPTTSPGVYAIPLIPEGTGIPAIIQEGEHEYVHEFERYLQRRAQVLGSVCHEVALLIMNHSKTKIALTLVASRFLVRPYLVTSKNPAASYLFGVEHSPPANGKFPIQLRYEVFRLSMELMRLQDSCCGRSQETKIKVPKAAMRPCATSIEQSKL